MSSPVRAQISRLRSGGFDRSRTSPDSPHHVRVGCSQCEALVINGHPCHETGCPNTRRAQSDDEPSDSLDSDDDLCGETTCH